jgi:NitT/TauT family transport system permease protein
MDVLTEQELAIPSSNAKGVIPEAIILRIASVAVLLIIWQFLSFMLSARYVPGPLLTFSALAENIASGAILRHFTATMVRMLVSFALAMVGLTIPSLCYIIVSFLWLGLNDRAAVLAISWTTFPSIAINIWQGVKAVDQRLVDMACVFRASRWRRTVRVVIPQVLPYMMAAARFGLGVVWKVTVLVELLGRSDGVGYMLNYSFQMFKMADVFAWTLFFSVIMLVIELAVLKPLENRLFRWRPEIRA